MASEATLKLLLLGEDRSAGKTLKGVGKDAETTGQKFGRLAKVSAVALAGGLFAAGAAMVKLGQQASDLGETQSKVAQIFGKEAVDALDEFSDAAAKNLGQSKQQALDAAATFGIIGKSAGKSGKDLVDFSTEMTALAGDMASFNNSTPEEAIEAIGSAMRGEAEPIRKYGVLLDDATLRNEALKLGLIDSVKEGLTPQQKALAAQAAILKQTKDAQGDFARTSDGLANKQRILKAELANLGTELGQKALPIMLDVTNAAVDLAEGFEDGTGAGGEIRDVLEDVADTAKAVKEVFEAIPGPVKSFAVQAGLAVLVVSKLRTLMAPMSVGLTTMTTNFKSAETRAAGLKAGLRGLGSGLSTAAGAGGMMLLADSTDETTKQMGALKGAAGGALSGAALGGFAGPVGAGIGAAIGGLAGMTLGLLTSQREVEEQVLHGIPSWREYGETLDGVAASTTGATRAMVLQRLEKSGLLAATRQLGLTDRQAVQAMMGNTDARKKLSAALANNHTLTDEQRAALVKETGAVAQSRKTTLLRNIALAGTETELKKAKTALRNFMKEPANKRVNISGVEQASQKLRGLRTLLMSTLKVSGSPITGISGSLTDAYGGGGFKPKGASAVGGRVNESGFRLFGEHGPEIGYVPTGTQVYSATQTDQMRAGTTSDGRTVIIENHFGVGTDRRAAAREIVGMLKELGVTTGAPVTV